MSAMPGPGSNSHIKAVGAIIDRPPMAQAGSFESFSILLSCFPMSFVYLTF